MESYPGLTIELVPRIAALLGVAASTAAYQAGGQPVSELRVPSLVLNIEIRLILWPGLGRADVRIGDSSLVFKQIDAVELYPGVEVLFRRREPAGCLFVSIGGRASMVV